MSNLTTAAPGFLPTTGGPPVVMARPRTSVLRIVHELWDARDLVVQFVRRDITIRYTQAVMGFAWALFMPLLIVGAGLIFRLVMSAASGHRAETSDVAGLLVRSMPWSFFSAALSTATQSVLAYANLIGKVKFPREALPVSSVAAQGADLVIGAAFVVIALPFLGVSGSFTWLWALVMLVLLIAFTIGCSLLLSCANLFYRDVKYIVQVVLQFGVFATPVFFAPELLPRRARAIMLALPLTPFIEGIDAVDRAWAQLVAHARVTDGARAGRGVDAVDAAVRGGARRGDGRNRAAGLPSRLGAFRGDGVMESRLIFDGVWKRFRRGQVHDSLRDLIPALTRKLSGKERAELEERDFWALRDISFEVKPGEVLGIIGGNGAGKSTTLKILNELMEPTKGRVVAEGKIGSLIEVSAGFTRI